MKTIHHLEVRDFLGVRRAALDPKKLTVFAGDNGEGKTSLLKAIRAAFEGLPDGAIRQGANKAEILIDLSDLRIERSMTAKGWNYLKVYDGEGRQLPKPQTLLNALRGAFAFNPIEFLRLSPREQRGYLLEALPLELPADAIDETDPPRDGEHALEYLQRRAQALESGRRTVSRSVRDALGAQRQAEERLAEIKKDLGEPPGLSLEEAAEAERRARDELVRRETQADEYWKRAAETDEQRAELERLRTERVASDLPGLPSTAEAKREVEGLRSQIARLTERLRDQEEQLARCQQRDRDVEAHARRIQELSDRLDTGLGDKPDVGVAEALLAAAENTLADCQAHQRAEAARREVQTARARHDHEKATHDQMTEQLDRLRDELPRELVRTHAADLAGLELDDDGLRWRGRPLANLATAEQIAIALSIVHKLSGELGVICVDGIESLSEKRRASFYKAIAKDEYQYFVTRVGEPTPDEVAVSGGEIRSA